MAFTFFFRDSHTLTRVAEKFIPFVEGYSKIKIWNAGCAMGPEPFTFAIILAEKMSYFAFKRVYIDATDIDETDTFGSIINSAVYPESDLRRIPPEFLTKYFVKTGDDGYFRVQENLRNRIRFTKHDLLTLKPIDTGYHLVICKNVLLHLQPQERIDVIKMYHSVLAPNGLFTTEQTQAMPEECAHLFEPLASDAHVYKKIG